MNKEIILLSILLLSNISIAENNSFICATEKTLSDMSKYGFSNEYIMINHGTSILVDGTNIYNWGLSSKKWLSYKSEQNSNSVSWSSYSKAMQEMSFHNLNFIDLTLSSKWGEDSIPIKSKCMKTSWNDGMRIAKKWIPLGVDPQTKDSLYFHRSYKEDSALGKTYRIYKMLHVYSTLVESSKSSVNYLQTWCDDTARVFWLEARHCSDTLGDKCEDKERVWSMLEDLPEDSFFRTANKRICSL